MGTVATRITVMALVIFFACLLVLFGPPSPITKSVTPRLPKYPVTIMETWQFKYSLQKPGGDIVLEEKILIDIRIEENTNEKSKGDNL